MSVARNGIPGRASGAERRQLRPFPRALLSIIDSTGAGSYRYYVRASNAGGASAYAGPAPVTVTASTSTSSKKVPPGKR